MSYLKHPMPSPILPLGLLLLFFTLWGTLPALAETFVSGDVTGEWTLERSPYFVIGNINIPDGRQLIIDPGVLVFFTGAYQFTTYGFLSARGDTTNNRLITFTSDSLVWMGLRFDHSDNRSHLDNCIIHNAWVGVDCISSQLRIEGCFIYARSIGINLDASSPTITNNPLIQVVGNNINDPRITAINLYNGSNPIIRNNKLIQCTTDSYGEAYGICIREYSNPIIEENWIEVASGRKSRGIDAQQVSKLEIKHNIIKVRAHQEMAGIHLVDATGVHIINNDIIIEEGTCIDAIGADIGRDCQLSLTNNIFLGNYTSVGVHNEGQLDAITGYNLFWQHNEPYSGEWDNFEEDSNLVDKDPKFIPGGYHLYWEEIGNFESDHSPCIDAGYTEWRDPDGTRSDIGRYYLYYVPYSAPTETPGTYSLLVAYPNPFNGTVRVEFSLLQAENASLTIRDATGRLIRELLNANATTGWHSTTWDATGAPAGSYLLTLHTPTQTYSQTILYLP